MTRISDCLKLGNIFFEEKVYTPETVRASIDAVAEILTKKFISNSPFVYLYAPNHIKIVYALFGILAAGKTCVLVDPKIGRFELEEMLKDSPPGAIIKPEKAADTFDYNLEFEFKHYQLAPSRIAGMDDVAIMLYTAAEDGFAKGAMLTHENILANARAGLEANLSCPDLTTCAIIPFHHLFALQTGIIMPLIVAGNALIIEPSEGISAAKIGEQLAYHPISNLFASPLIFFILRKLRDAKDLLNSIASLTSGGYSLPTSIFETYQEKLGIEIREGYGITEASPICAWNRPGDVVKQGSVGRAFSCCKIKIVDEQNVELPIGDKGEICICGENVFKGYYLNHEATRNILSDKTLHTGDFGVLNEDGYLFFKGLKKRMLNIAGNKVYPSELERLMKKNHNVREVEVSGDPDELLGEKVRARVRLRNNTPEAQDLCRQWCLDNITRYKVPRVFDFVS